MNTQELEKLLAEVTLGDWEWCAPRHGFEYDSNEGYLCGFYSGDVTICSFGDNTHYYNMCGDPPSESNARLIALAPQLARRVIAAAKLVDALRYYSEGTGDLGEYGRKALSEWESAQ